MRMVCEVGGGWEGREEGEKKGEMGMKMKMEVEVVVVGKCETCRRHFGDGVLEEGGAAWVCVLGGMGMGIDIGYPISARVCLRRCTSKAVSRDEKSDQEATRV